VTSCRPLELNAGGGNDQDAARRQPALRRRGFREEPDYFIDLGHEQNPTVLWIGCSDSRVPVNTITQTRAGEVFANRNIQPWLPCPV